MSDLGRWSGDNAARNTEKYLAFREIDANLGGLGGKRFLPLPLPPPWDRPCI